MGRHLIASLAAALLLARPAAADMGTPGFARVPHDYVIEVASDFPGYGSGWCHRAGSKRWTSCLAAPSG
jgi:hypothetical protein